MKPSMIMCLACALTASAPAQSTEATRQVSIFRMLSVSSARPAASASNFSRVYFAPNAWGSTTCRQDAADVRVDDWQIFSVLMTAWKENRPITIVVDDALRLDSSDTVCQVVVAYIDR